MTTSYLITYGKDPSDRFAAHAYKTRKMARAASLALVPGKLPPGAVPGIKGAGGCAYVISGEEDVSFSGSLLVAVYNRIAKKTVSKFASRADGVKRLLGVLSNLPEETFEIPASMEENIAMATTTQKTGGKTKATKATKTGKAAAAKAASNGGERQWKGLADDAKLHIRAESCPRRAGTASADNWAKYKEGMTVAQLRAAGVIPSKLRTDIANGHVEVR